VSKHTPGPWKFSKYGSIYSGNTYVFGPVGEVDTGPDIKFANETDERLVLAAPEMYELLFECTEVLKDCQDCDANCYGMVSELVVRCASLLKTLETNEEVTE